MLRNPADRSVLRVATVIANAVDLVGSGDLTHSRRVAVMARECARALQFDEAAADSVFLMGLVHDCGVSSSAARQKIVEHMEWSGVHEHCERGAALLSNFAPLAPLAPVVLKHHTRWRNLEAADDPVNLYANLICLVDHVDVLAAPSYPEGEYLIRTDELRAAIKFQTGDFFAPKLVDAFLEVSRNEAFWLLLAKEHVIDYVADLKSGAGLGPMGIPELRAFGSLVASIVDAKSHFTAEHSHGVAALSRHLGRLVGLPEAQCERLEIAGLLHDIGKLQVSDSILDKAGALTQSERIKMKGHSFATMQILHHIEGIDDIVTWAGHHHESLNGEGYPFRLRGSEISTEARLIRIADVYQAMAQARPYRPQTPAGVILDQLRQHVRDGLVDGHVVDVLADNLGSCHRIATQPRQALTGGISVVKASAA
jgi:HD-GYP domain-containing protein (c-di-GMP phosphodiesterase class II)